MNLFSVGSTVINLRHLNFARFDTDKRRLVLVFGREQHVTLEGEEAAQTHAWLVARSQTPYPSEADSEPGDLNF